MLQAAQIQLECLSALLHRDAITHILNDKHVLLI